MIQFGHSLAGKLGSGSIVFLNGDLGAGKTTIIKGILQGLGYNGNVTSPTFTLVESYSLAGQNLFHFDLYRLESSQELEAIGIRDMLDGSSITLFEWPEKSGGLLPPPDLTVDITFTSEGRHVTVSGELGTQGE